MTFRQSSNLLRSITLNVVQMKTVKFCLQGIYCGVMHGGKVQRTSE
ncbi:hypothetical protein TDB9533_03235 [Thalassocella blandensis]|nr:hypothetical protein TDB9533_03235 [Thalassocella blandensis]